MVYCLSALLNFVPQSGNMFPLPVLTVKKYNQNSRITLFVKYDRDLVIIVHLLSLSKVIQ